VFDRRKIGVRGIVGAPLGRGHHRVEALAVQVAIVDLVTGLRERLDDGFVQRSRKAVGERMSEENEDAHRGPDS
jgi:hypothetical protein